MRGGASREAVVQGAVVVIGSFADRILENPGQCGSRVSASDIVFWKVQIDGREAKIIPE
jgi:hypothetical protein|tara:strand:+ start:54 stop:230 length:177 start_codon:yes stop_codon:yes gene_type:complete